MTPPTAIRARRERRARSAVAVLAAALLGACAVGPDYRAPLPGAPAQSAFVGGEAPEFSAAEPPGDWWRLYDDARLNEAVQAALDANTDLRAAGANLARAEAMLRGARGRRLPETTLSAGTTSGRRSFVGQGAAVSFEDTIYDVGLDVSYQVDLLGRVSRSIEAASANAQAAQAAYASARITVAAETASAFAQACAAGLELDVAERSLDLQSESFELTEQLLEAGRGTALDVARASALLADTRARVPTLEAQRRTALYRLAVLMGRPPAEFPAAAAECREPPTLESTLPVGDGAGLLRRRPDVRRAERELAAATAGIGVAVADMYPSVRIGASVGAVALSADELDGSDASQWTLGPLLSWTFPNRSAARARLEGARAEADAALAEFDGAWLDALRETEAALAEYTNELERLAALGESRGHSAEAVRLARARFEAGRVSFLDVLQAEITLADAEAAHARSRARVAALQVTLFLALGGGWDAS